MSDDSKRKEEKPRGSDAAIPAGPSMEGRRGKVLSPDIREKIASAFVSSLTGMSGTSGATSDSISSLASFPRTRSILNPETIKKTHELEEMIARLRREANDLAAETQRAKASERAKGRAIEEYEAKIKQLLEQERLHFLLSRVNEEAKKLLLESNEFREQFLGTTECDAFVMSIDIRRSTELMSKARTPQKFADFMTTLCKALESLIKENYGVVDKFTGDGVLAFFPDFFSGNDAGFYVVSVADECHKIFYQIYRDFRSSFISVLNGVGLGIGIDYGHAHLVQIAGGLTVVGAPVVYACRMGGAPGGTTLLNQPGYEKICEQFGTYCFFQETEIDIKNEGRTLAYQVKLNGKEYLPLLPAWLGTETEIIENEKPSK